MILYSIIPPEIVFGNYYDKREDKTEPEQVEADYRGEKVEAVRLEGNRYMITRLLSTSPQAFLDPKFMPGTIVENLRLPNRN